jgi:hypothetical protein
VTEKLWTIHRTNEYTVVMRTQSANSIGVSGTGRIETGWAAIFTFCHHQMRACKPGVHVIEETRAASLHDGVENERIVKATRRLEQASRALWLPSDDARGERGLGSTVNQSVSGG